MRHSLSVGECTLPLLTARALPLAAAVSVKHGCQRQCEQRLRWAHLARRALRCVAASVLALSAGALRSLQLHTNESQYITMRAQVAAAIYARIAPLLAGIDRLASIDGMTPASCAPNIRLYRYGPGDSFGRHIDESSTSPAGTSKLTLLVYLTGGGGDGEAECDEGGRGECECGEAAGDGGGRVDDADTLRGGATVFYKGYSPQVLALVEPRAGRLLLHGHGDRCLLHEAAAVKHGVKYVLRTDVVYQ